MFFATSPNFPPFWRSVWLICKWALLGALVGVLCGVASAIFLISLDAVTAFRIANPLIILGLPVAGVLIVWVYQRYGAAAQRGTALIVAEVNAPQERIPLRMTPFILFGTLLTHLCGGSVGREGTAVQMGASLADTLRRVLRLTSDERRLLLMAGISGGFGSVFGTPIAGFVFGMEVQQAGRIHYDGLVPCLTAAMVGNWVTRSLGVTHSHLTPLPAMELEPLLMLKVVLAAVAFGMAARLFVWLTEGIKHRLAHSGLKLWMRPALGGLAVLGLSALLGTQDYLGLSLPLLQQSLDPNGQVLPLAFLFKLLFTAITLGSGFVGGEVTPLFIIGASLGHTLAAPLGMPVPVLASLGFVALFAAASNAPLTCILLGVELFGGGDFGYVAVACVVAYLSSGQHSIYHTQPVHTPKTPPV